MSHAVCAYLGLYTGREYLYEAVAEPYIRLIAREAMVESVASLAQEYGVLMQELLRHCDDLLMRFSNKSLGDTCARVGGDPARKLRAADRLIGAALYCEKHGILPVGISIGAAGAVYQYLNEKEQLQKGTNAESALLELAGLAPENQTAALILKFYQYFCRGTNPEQLFCAAETIKDAAMPEIV
jgi:mannitol-1-phosphate 5-dehydrogenase